jgi:hypothetical protein
LPCVKLKLEKLGTSLEETHKELPKEETTISLITLSESAILLTTALSQSTFAEISSLETFTTSPVSITTSTTSTTLSTTSTTTTSTTTTSSPPKVKKQI